MSARLKAWLRKPPQPVAVLCDDKRVEVPKTGRPWIELSNTIESLNPTKLVALGANGEVLRAKEMEGESVEESPSLSPEASDLQHFAKLLADAYDKSGKNFAPLLDSAMAFIARQADQIASQSREIERLRTHNHKLQAELIAATAMGEVDGEGETSIVTQIAQGFLAAQAGGAPPMVPTLPRRPPQPRRDHTPRPKQAPNGRPTPPKEPTS